METKDYVLSPCVYTCLLPQGGTLLISMSLQIMNVTTDISFCISDLFHMGLPSGSLLPSLLIMVFKFHVFFLNIGKVGLWLQYFDEWKAIIFTLPLVFCLRLSHRKTSVIVKVHLYSVCNIYASSVFYSSWF